MTNPEYVENLKSSALQLGMIALSMEDFASQIIRHVISGGELNDATFYSIKKNCINNLKNSESRGLPIDQEAKSFNQAISHFEALMDGAIAKGRK